VPVVSRLKSGRLDTVAGWGLRHYIVRLWKRAAFIESGTAGELSIVSASNTTWAKNSICPKIATAPEATSRLLINCHGKTRARAAMPRGPKARSASPTSREQSNGKCYISEVVGRTRLPL
jgi:hypothetical protein